jgi:four helix bundle protein
VTDTADTSPKYDLGDRLLEFAVQVLRLTERMHPTRAGTHIADQLMRSGTSPLLNHGEAQAAESAKDFIHKLHIALKELKETRRALQLIVRVPLIADTQPVAPLLAETEELIRIMAASIRTAKSRVVRETPSEWMIEQEGSER